MYKILIIDRCYFSRFGLETWLQQVNGSHIFLVTSLNSLLLARAHIESWQPHLVIADLSGFERDPQQAHVIPPLLNLCNQRSRLLLLHPDAPDYSATAVASKQVSLDVINHIIHTTLHSGPSIPPARIATPLLTRQEEKVLSLWMEGASNLMIAREMNINSKTVYTYKRNIRLKLNMENRFSPFIPLADCTQ
ncbi:helix-turn-helix transcriptional regulator [[Enterobacter] lignolyticus]|uniref:Transcriptional regulator, LuxR family n=2 Tax=[Enterobacter] lignolyticus TaxID=1334193 RepID=E3G1F6_ENTLS|nr:LuxR C-terminal-related transcriptional regulator [[Enterobacter] lignolyticus]ADO50241.1 transcriptional regulator, LuxR family [[Enterobacter] lignolyticus SCF1]ALR75111.1 hypothetical protein AO703_01920 [[Enterobacter] lignolyticus]